jgi:hypothetical protein
MKTSSLSFAEFVLFIAFAVAILLSTGCGKAGDALKTGEIAQSITHDQCVQFLKWRILDGSVTEWQSSIHSVSEVEVDGYSYRMTDECRSVIQGYQTLDTTRHR